MSFPRKTVRSDVRYQPVLGEPYQGQTLQGMLFILAITLWTKPLRFNI